MEVGDLEDIYRIFNVGHPENFKGRSLSVSDIVEIVSGNVDTGYYYCDTIGFKKISFDPKNIPVPPNLGMIKVLLVEPGRIARLEDIGSSLKDLQEAVGGYIEAYYPFQEKVSVVCNEEGKFNGSLPNRAVYDNNGKIQEIIFGTFFICGCGDENFSSLSEEQAEKYMELFKYPQHFFKTGNEIIAVSYDPVNK